jgi:hypothetical protein
LKDAILRFDGVETPSGAYVFQRLEDSIEALMLVDIVIDIPAWASVRESKIRRKNGKIILEFRAESHDPIDQMKGWVKESGYWKKIIGEDTGDDETVDTSNLDDWIRYSLNPDYSDRGWYLFINGKWSAQTLTNIKHRLYNTFKKESIVKDTVGNLIDNAWTIENTPFIEEYPGNRVWNFGPQLRYQVSDITAETPTWDSVYAHLGAGIDADARKQLGISGKQYLLYWTIALLRQPQEPLPYLFFYGPQNSGKTTFHESLHLLFDSGYIKADAALTTTFNAELANAVLCVIEEVNIRSKNIYNKIKDFVTGRQLLIHEKNRTPYMVKNFTHWIQVANDFNDCPIFNGDTRITAIPVAPLENYINRRDFERQLVAEAQYFLNKVYYANLPEYNDRLLIPALSSSAKTDIADRNDNDIETFLKEVLDGEMLFGELYDTFIDEFGGSISKIKFGKMIPMKYERVRRKSDNQLIVRLK